jgi:hypothetical protein
MVSIPATAVTFTLAAVLALAALAAFIAVELMAGAPLPRLTFYRRPVPAGFTLRALA